MSLSTALKCGEGIRDRLSSSVDIALDLSQGILKIIQGREGKPRYYTETYVCPESGLSFAPLEPADFNYRSQRGACPACHGKGGVDVVIPDRLWMVSSPLSLNEQVLGYLDCLPRKTGSLHKSVWTAYLNLMIKQYSISVGILPSQLSPKLMEGVLYGSDDDLSVDTSIRGEFRKVLTHWKGLIPLIEHDVSEKQEKSLFFNEDLITWKECPQCRGGKLKPESLACLIDGLNIHQICALMVSEALTTLASFKFSKKSNKIAKEILPEILSRLDFWKGLA